jgi:hypothetical protein
MLKVIAPKMARRKRKILPEGVLDLNLVSVSASVFSLFAATSAVTDENFVSKDDCYRLECEDGGSCPLPPG